MICSACDDASAWASVLATRKSTPDRPEVIILLTALQPPPPTPQTMMRGFNSLSSGALRLIVICQASHQCVHDSTPLSFALGRPVAERVVLGNYARRVEWRAGSK